VMGEQRSPVVRPVVTDPFLAAVVSGRSGTSRAFAPAPSCRDDELSPAASVSRRAGAVQLKPSLAAEIRRPWWP
jgi:hypothetical protein